MKKEPPGSFFHSGFSLLELVVIIVIIGILTVAASARILDGVAQSRGFYDELLSQVQFARKVAVAQRRPVFVVIQAAQSRLCYAADCIDGVASPTGEVPFRLPIPSGVAPTVVTFQFDALGRPRNDVGVLTGAPLIVTVTGDINYQISVQHETGYVQ